jgi:predicted permease
MRASPAQHDCAVMAKHPILDVPLDQVMRAEIALPLQQVLRLYTVGNLLNAWRSPRNHKSIEQVFDTPQQARHAVAVCTAFLGFEIPAVINPISAWWSGQMSC